MSYKVLAGDFLLELSIISAFLEFLISLALTLTLRAAKQKAGPSAAAQE